MRWRGLWRVVRRGWWGVLGGRRKRHKPAPACAGAGIDYSIGGGTLRMLKSEMTRSTSVHVTSRVSKYSSILPTADISWWG